MSRYRVLRASCAFLVGLVLGGFAASSWAVMTIDICGSSTYTCPQNDEYSQAGSKDSKLELRNNVVGSSTTVGLSTSYQGETPAGWTSPTQPPSSISQKTTICFSSSQCIAVQSGTVGPFTTEAEACADFSGKYGQPTGLTWQYNGGNFCGKNGYGGFPPLTNHYCPAGYAGPSAGMCTLNNPPAVQKPRDGQCSIKRVGNNFSGDPNDPDCTLNSAARNDVGNPTPNGNQVNASAPNGKTVNVTVNVDGTMTITVGSPDYTKGTTTTTTVRYGAPDATGAPTAVGFSKTESQGIGTGANPSGNALTKGDMPTDYTRENTQLAIKAVLDAIKGSVDSAGISDGKGKEDQPKSALDTQMTDRQTKLGEVTGASGKDTSWGFSLDMPTGAGCGPVVLAGTTIDVCAQVPKLREIVGWVWYICTAFLMIGMVGNTIRGS